MKIHLLSGFLGSGKTTAIQQAAGLLLQQGIIAGVVTNDQGAKLVDGSFFKNLHIPNREVINGCFCCNYKDLDAGITALQQEEKVEVIFAESVGSCTDIVATVLKPLLQHRADTPVTISVFADARLLQMMLSGTKVFDEAISYIYLKQLEEAGIIVVSKIDLVKMEELAEIKKLLQEKYTGKTLLYQNSLNSEDIAHWIKVLDNDSLARSLPSLNIDYDIYAEGEAKMAWFDQVLEITSADNTAMQQLEKLVNTLYRKVQQGKYPIGHLKFLTGNGIKISFTSGAEAAIALQHVPAGRISLLVNMRVETTPQILERIVNEAIEETIQLPGCSIVVSSQSAFQPGYPRPAYRM